MLRVAEVPKQVSTRCFKVRWLGNEGFSWLLWLAEPGSRQALPLL